MLSRVTFLLLAALPAFTGLAGGEVVSVVGSVAPSFAPHQETLVVAPLGHAASLDCTVHRLLDKSVSWVRSSDLQILSHAGVTFTADARVSATSVALGAGATQHSLRIERLRASDAGRYECQVNTEPKMSLFFNLTVVDEPVPVVVVSAVGGGEVSGAVGGAATLSCEARYEPSPRLLPLATLNVRWLRDDRPIDLQSGRGGVSLDTERWSSRVLSRLTLAELRAGDAGLYVCSAAGQQVYLRLHVLHESSAEAMQRDEGEPMGDAATHTVAPLHALTLILVLVAVLSR